MSASDAPEGTAELIARIRRDVDRLRECLDPTWSPVERAAVLAGMIEAIAYLNPADRPDIRERVLRLLGRIEVEEGGPC